MSNEKQPPVEERIAALEEQQRQLEARVTALTASVDQLAATTREFAEWRAMATPGGAA